MRSSAPVEVKESKSVTKGITNGKRLYNRHGSHFTPTLDGRTIAFIQGGYDGSPTSVRVWDVEKDNVIVLEHKRDSGDHSRIEGLTLADDRYLIAALTPALEPRGPGYIGAPIEGRNNELLIWDLKDLSKKSPLSRTISSVASERMFHDAIVTEDNTVMAYYIDGDNSRKKHWQATVATFQISKGVLAEKKVFSLSEGSFHLGLSQKGLIYELADNNRVIVNDADGTTLAIHYFCAQNGVLLCGDKPFDIKGDNIYSITKVDSTTMALRINNESHYIVDMTNFYQPKQLGFVDINKLEIDKASPIAHYMTIIPMNYLAKEYAVVNQHHAGLIFLYDLKQNKVLGRYKINQHNTSDVAFDGSLYQGTLISSQYERVGEEVHTSISIQAIDLLQRLVEIAILKQASKLAVSLEVKGNSMADINRSLQLAVPAGPIAAVVPVEVKMTTQQRFLQECDEDLKEYIASFARRKDVNEIVKELKLTDAELEKLGPKYEDPIHLELMSKPVYLFGQAFNFNTILDAMQNGVGKCPIKTREFKAYNVQAARDKLEEIETLLKQIEKDRQAKKAADVQPEVVISSPPGGVNLR